MKKTLFSWTIPIIFSTSLFFVLRPAFAHIVQDQQSPLSNYLKTGNVEVDREVNNGFSRVYYVYDGQKTYVSQEGANSKQEYSRGQYIVWITEVADAPGQVYLHDILSGSTTQLTFSGNNANPKVSKEGYVVWEGWIASEVPPSQGFGEASWQIFFFDGVKTVQLTSGDPSFNPEIDGDYITYTRRDITGTYRGVLYSIKNGQERDITTGIDAKYPKVRNGKIFLGGVGVEREFGLTAEDLFVLDLLPLESTESATHESYELEDSRINAVK